jgi:hypothetical protein
MRKFVISVLAIKFWALRIGGGKRGNPALFNDRTYCFSSFSKIFLIKAEI